MNRHFERFAGEYISRSTFSRLGFSFLIGAVFVQLVSFALFSLCDLFLPTLNISGDMELALSSAAVYLAGMPLIFLLVRGMPHVHPIRNHMRPARFGKAFLMCYAIVFVSNLVGNVLTGIVSFLRQNPVNNDVLELMENTSFPTQLLFAVIIAPVMEELIFRKCIVDRTLIFGDKTAIFFSGLMFGLFHGNLNQFAYAFTLGMFLAYLYIRTGNIKITIAFHMIINAGSTLIAFVLLKMLDLEKFLEVAEGGDPVEELTFFSENLPAMAVIFLYSALLFAVVVSGVILLALNARKFRFLPGEITIPREAALKTAFYNPGMIAFVIYFVMMIIVQLFQ